MKVIRYAFIHFKRMVKSPVVIGVMLLMPTVVLGIIGYSFRKETAHETSNVAFAVEDRGEYGHKFLEKIEANGNKSIYSSKNIALESLKKNQVLAVYIIPENFTEQINKGIKPEIQSFKRAEGNGTSYIEATMEEELIKLTKAKFLSSKGIINEGEEISTTIKVKEEKIQGKNQVLYMIILMITSLIIFSANSVGTELINMKKQKVLFRAITTPNTGYEIMGGLYLGFFLVQAIIYTAVLFIEEAFLGFSFEGLLPIIFVNMLLTVLISVSIGLAVTRVVENEGVATLIIYLFGIITTFVSMGATIMAGDNMPQIIKSIGKFTPQYWVINSIDTGVLFPNAMILILMAVAVFTAGSFRIRSFVNK
ncbi:hypothetical protein SDC9_82675 [bioreactor metagenome]|uniref:ABC-2 type transporter transmembrane domain-containing protein n=1 Tax=bioreactor metagenome TaxID=1076179 RepID=A0A644Z5J0_9ZZZZ